MRTGICGGSISNEPGRADSDRLGHFHCAGYLARLETLTGKVVQRLPRLLGSGLALMLLLGCGPPPAQEERAGDGAPLRIVSLAPHLTELAFAAGAGESVVGTVEFSDYPAAALAVPRVGDAFNVDFERIAQLAPDVVLAWEGGTPGTIRERLVEMGLVVRVLGTSTLADVATRLEELGRMAGNESLAYARAQAYREQLQALHREVVDNERPGIFYQISLDPLYTVGQPHFITELIELCGGRNIFADLDLLSAAVSHEAVLARNPRLILVSKGLLSEARAHWERFGLFDTSAASQVQGVDPDLVTRPSLRLADGAAQICQKMNALRSSSEVSELR